MYLCKKCYGLSTKKSICSICAHNDTKNTKMKLQVNKIEYDFTREKFAKVLKQKNSLGVIKNDGNNYFKFSKVLNIINIGHLMRMYDFNIGFNSIELNNVDYPEETYNKSKEINLIYNAKRMSKYELLFIMYYLDIVYDRYVDCIINDSFIAPMRLFELMVKSHLGKLDNFKCGKYEGVNSRQSRCEFKWYLTNNDIDVNSFLSETYEEIKQKLEL